MTLKSKCFLVFLALTLVTGIASAQSATGSVSGTVTDEQGAVIPNAKLTLTNKETGFIRDGISAANGSYSVPALPAGNYGVHVEAAGFSSRERVATVVVGSATRVDFQMKIGATKDTVTVEAAGAEINYENHAVQGVIQRETIQDLPLNGRSFLQLSALEPGVTIASGSTAQFNALFTVSVLGSGNRTLVTMDGGNISDNVDVGGGMSSMNFSQEVVQEFQLSTVNFDISTGISRGGALNVVTRSGGNKYHGSAYFFFRDHNMAAYPSLQRSVLNPNPFFARRNPGFWLGGPLKKDKIFFFVNFEHTNQVQAVAVASTTPSYQLLNGTYGSPYVGKLFSLRLDDRISSKHTAFLRYSHDGNAGFGQSLQFGDPSNWVHNRNWSDQSILGLTSSFTPNLVNDLRFQFNYWNNHNDQAVSSDCASPCIAGSLPSIYSNIGSNYPATGPNFNAPQGRNSRRYEIVEALNWQHGTHRVKIGGAVNRVVSAGLWGFCTPFCAGAFAPEYIRTVLAGYGPLLNTLFPLLPTQLKSDADVLNLPVYNQGASIFSGVGVGSVSTPAPYDHDQNKASTQYRAYIQDTWKIRPNLTVNFGLAWNAQTGFYNSDLPKPAFLKPIVGADNGPTVNNTKEFQPAFGFAWSPGKNSKTVIRGGAGLYWDSTPVYYKLREAPVIGPVGDGRSTLTASAFTNDIPGISIVGAALTPIGVGTPLPLGVITTMTVGQFAALVARQLPAVAARLTPTPPTSGPYTTTGIDVAKQGVEIYPSHFPLARSYQTSIGFQRDLGHGMLIQADYAMRLAINSSMGELDYNLFNRFLGTPTPAPVIPQCTAAQALIVSAQCSTGSITFWTDQGRAIYNGLLTKFTKRGKKYNVLVSYAFQKASANTVNVWNQVNWGSNYGQYLEHNNITIAGTWNLPLGFQITANSSYVGAAPATVSVSGLIMPGTVASGGSEPLPTLQLGCANISCGQPELADAVSRFNSTIAGTKDAKGATIAPLTLPTGNYSFGQGTMSQDFRLTKNFTFKEQYKLGVFVEMFNTFNVSNLTGFPLTINAAGFGQPTGRTAQTFGSGGPRAVQIGGRFTF